MADHVLKHPTQCIGTYFYGQNDIFEVFEVFEGFSFFLPIVRRGAARRAAKFMASSILPWALSPLTP